MGGGVLLFDLLLPLPLPVQYGVNGERRSLRLRLIGVMVVVITTMSIMVTVVADVVHEGGRGGCSVGGGVSTVGGVGG